MTTTFHGTIHGKTIQLVENPGIADGQAVEITIKTKPLASSSGAGLRRCAGALAQDWSVEHDRILEEIYMDRKRDLRKDLPE